MSVAFSLIDNTKISYLCELEEPEKKLEELGGLTSEAARGEE